MKDEPVKTGRMITLIRHFCGLVMIFMIQKPLFMLYTGGIGLKYGIKDWLLVIWHGLPIDLSVAAYLTVLPLLIIIVGFWIQALPVKRIIQVYDCLASLLLSSIFVSDTVLYPFQCWRKGRCVCGLFQYIEVEASVRARGKKAEYPRG